MTISSPLNLPATMPEHASQLYSKNVAALLELMLDENGTQAPDFSDEILAESCVTRSAEQSSTLPTTGASQ
ncbi:alanine dehydrogenase/PNT-like protein [Rhodococcus sp. SMB37]|nr:alanine dehydrogenase/PNT-like protein [Rhodococcus sp. SMB37]